jgi:hypothetical protein
MSTLVAGGQAMKLNQYRSILRSAGLAAGSALFGGVAVLMLMQYQGQLEVRFSAQETYIMLDGNQCSWLADRDRHQRELSTETKRPHN